MNKITFEQYFARIDKMRVKAKNLPLKLTNIFDTEENAFAFIDRCANGDGRFLGVTSKIASDYGTRIISASIMLKGIFAFYETKVLNGYTKPQIDRIDGTVKNSWDTKEMESVLSSLKNKWKANPEYLLPHFDFLSMLDFIVLEPSFRYLFSDIVSNNSKMTKMFTDLNKLFVDSSDYEFPLPALNVIFACIKVIKDGKSVSSVPLSEGTKYQSDWSNEQHQKIIELFTTGVLSQPNNVASTENGDDTIDSILNII